MICSELWVGVRAWLPMLLLLLLAGCGGEPTPARGSAVERAAGENARAATLATSADQAALTASRSAAHAQALADEAARDPSPARIAAAADARIAAAVDQAVAQAARQLADRAQDAAAVASRAAAAERDHNDREAAERSRLERAWWSAAAATVIAVVAAGLLISLGAPRRWLLAPASIGLAGWGLYAWATWATWIAVLLGGVFLAAFVVVVVLAVRHVIRIEWPDAAGSLRTAMPEAADAHDARSVARQIPPVRALIDWLLP